MSNLVPSLVVATLLATAVAIVAPLPPVGRGLVALLAVVSLLLAFTVTLLGRLVHVVGPGEVLVLSGVNRAGPDGTERGYRIVRRGRVMQVPLLETATWLELGPFSLSLDLRGVYARTGPVDLRVSATIGISTDPEVMPNAVERFLGRSREELLEVARQTLEGALRSVAADLELEELQRGGLRVAEALEPELAADLERLGLALDDLVIEAAAAG